MYCFRGSMNFFILFLICFELRKTFEHDHSMTAFLIIIAVPVCSYILTFLNYFTVKIAKKNIYNLNISKMYERNIIQILRKIGGAHLCTIKFSLGRILAIILI